MEETLLLRLVMAGTAVVPTAKDLRTHPGALLPVPATGTFKSERRC